MARATGDVTWDLPDSEEETTEWEEAGPAPVAVPKLNGTPLERMTPQDPEAERSVLGSVLIDSGAIAKVIDYLTPDDFARQAHADIYAAMIALHAAHSPIDLVTLGAQLALTGRMETVGGPGVLVGLMASVPTAVHVEHYARIVAARALARRTIATAGRISAFGYEDVNNPDELLSRLRSVTDELIGSWRADPTALPAPEDRGAAEPSEMAETEYVEDLLRPGRIMVVAAEEGTGKSYAITGELGIRLAVAGGSFAETWPIMQTGPVLVLSEMHADDDYEREDIILGALGRTRGDLSGCYFRSSLMTAANGDPLLRSEAWREATTHWLVDHDAIAMIVDTATAASNVDPWGPEIQAIYRTLRAIIEAHPALAIVLIVHLKKPQGHGERRISDVLGEWGRWCDVLLMMEADGLARNKLTSRKRVRHQRRLTVTKRDGLLVEPTDIGDAHGPKVPIEDVVEAVRREPGITQKGLAKVLEVSKDTAGRYAAQAWAMKLLTHDKEGAKGAFRYFVAGSEESEDDLLGQIRGSE